LSIMGFGGQMYSEITGDWFSTFVILTSGYPKINWGILVTLFSVIGAVFFLIFGAISDNMRTRFGRRVPMLVIGTVATVILTALFVFSTNYLLMVVNYGILTAIMYNMVRGSTSPLVPDLIPIGLRGRVNMLTSVMGNLASAVAWIPALILLPGNGTSYPPNIVRTFVFAGAAIFGISFLISAPLIKEPQPPEAPRSWVKDLKSTLDWREMAKQKSFLILFVANFFVQAASSAIFNYLFVFVQSIKFTFDVGVIVAVVIVGASLALGIYFLSKAIDRIGRKFVTILGFSLAPIGSWFVAESNGNLVLLLIGFGVFLPFFLSGSAAINAWTQDIMPKESRGRFMGLLNISSAVGGGLGTIFAGFLADKFNIFFIFVAAAIILWVSIPIYLRVPETLMKKKNALEGGKIAE